MKQTKKEQTHDIAVVGMAVWYPGSRDLLELWENVLAKRKQFRRMLDSRLPLSEYQSDDKSAPDKTYGTRAAFIEGFEFDWTTNRFPKSAFESTDLAHWLALDVAGKAIRDAGLDRKTIPASRTGVIVGNSLAGETSRANGLRMRWPYVKKSLIAAAQSRGMDDNQIADFVQAGEHFFKSVLAPVTEDTLAGGLANTIAGRICNYYNLDGGGFTVDGACSSSLLAIANSASALTAGDLDLAIVGGVDVSVDAFELVGFAKVGALTDGDIKVYDRDGKGFIPAEGCGFVVLKRLEDAQRDGNKIYATLKGWGISSDGNGGITAPKASGQALALKRAYEKSGYTVSDCHFIEGHGTGTAVGDKRELEGISIAQKDTSEVSPRKVGMTSLKSIIGHTKAAAGIGAFIKAVIGVNRRILPPTSGCENPNPVFDSHALGLYPLIEGEVRPDHEKLRAGISAMGFGGINCHVTIESYGPPAEELAPTLAEKALMVSHSDAEIFVFSAQSVAGLSDQIRMLLQEAPHISDSEMTDISADVASRVVHSMPYRAAFLASSPKEFKERLEKLLVLMSSMPSEGQFHFDELSSIWISNKPNLPRVGFLFPGQGSQKINMARLLTERFPWAEQMLKNADHDLGAKVGTKLSEIMFRPLHRAANKEQSEQWASQLTMTQIAQPAICLASAIWAQRLSEIGIQCQAVAGHSLGELTALYWAGAYDFSTLMRITAARGGHMAPSESQAGSMLSLVCSKEAAEKIVEEIGEGIVIANINGPQQTVLSGNKEKIEEAARLAGSKGINSVRLNVSNAFHSPFVAEASKRFHEDLMTLQEGKGFKFPFVSGLDGRPMTHSDHLRTYLSEQIIRPVDFVSSVRTMAEKCDLLIEVGPGSVLSTLSKSILGSESSVKSFPVEAKPGKQADFLKVILAFYSMGGTVRFDKVFQNRLVRKYVSFSEKKFIVNPCEKPFPIKLAAPRDASAFQNKVSMPATPQTVAVVKTTPPLEVKMDNVIAIPRARVTAILLDVLGGITGFSKDVFKMEMRLLDDLNLDSIKASEVVSALAQKCNLKNEIDPIQMANATLGEIVDQILKMNPQEIPASSAFSPAANPIELAVQKTEEPKVQTPVIPLKESPESAMEHLYGILMKITGFEKSVFKPEMRLLEDLNLDSIKAGEVIVAMKAQYPNTSEIDPIQFANATLNDICQFFQSSEPAGPKVSSQNSRPEPISPLLKIVLEVTSQKSGYPISSLTPQMSFESDLRIEGKQFEDIIRLACAMIGVQPNVDIQSLRDCRIERLVSVLDSLQRSQVETTQPAAISQKSSNQKTWVRNFSTEMVLRPRIESQESESVRFVDQWPNAKVLFVHESEDNGFKEVFATETLSLGASFSSLRLQEAIQMDRRELSEYSHIIYLISSEDQKHSSTNLDRLRMTIERLHFLATLPKPEKSPRRSTALACVQLGDGSFNHSKFSLDFDQSVPISALQTLHVERPEIRIRCLDMAIGLKLNLMAKEVLREMQQKSSFGVTGFDIHGRRWEGQLKISSPSDYQNRNISWSSKDVVLFTGGAKGITAECALAFAKETGIRVALLGSSRLNPHLKDDELIRNLARFHEAGVTYQYYSCNVSDEKNVQQVIQKIQEEMGPITGIVHGAGKNTPRRLSHVTQEDAFQEISPKLLGAMNLMNAVDSQSLKLFCGFTSILGVMGIPGNGWYGFSNQALNTLLMKYRETHPHVATVACAFGMWDEVGMASKLGSGKKFGGTGLNLIPIHEGVRRFMELIKKDPGVQQVLVTARLWKDSQLAVPVKPSEKYRFLETIMTSTDSVEAISRCRLSVEKDLYLADHRYNGSYLFPTVFGLEAMAQVAAYATGIDPIGQMTIENLELTTAIIIDAEKGLEIEIHAEVEEASTSSKEKVVKVGIRSETSKFLKDSFSAVFRMQTEAAPKEECTIEKSSSPLNIDVKSKIYGPLLFHGKTFQRLNAFHKLNSKETVLEIQQSDSSSNQKAAFFNPKQEFILGDPYFRDGLLQSAQPVLSKHVALPVSCQKWEIRNTRVNPGIKLAHFKLGSINGKFFRSSVVCVDEKKEVLEILSEFQGVLIKPASQNPTPEELAASGPAQQDIEILPLVGEICSKNGWKCPTLRLTRIPGFEKMRIEDRHEVELELVRSGLNVSQVQVEWKDSGKPTLVNSREQLDLSISHVGDLCVWTAAKGRVGCDLEEIKARQINEWESLLGPHFSEIFQKLLKSSEETDMLGTMVWSAREAAGKAFESTDFQFTHLESSAHRVRFTARRGNDEVDVVVLKLNPIFGKNYVFAIASNFEKFEFPVSSYKNAFYIHPEIGGADGFRIVWPVTFKEAGNIGRSVYFSKFFEWAGRVRELAIFPLLKEASRIFTAGEFGWVTNSSKTQYFRSITVGDLLEARVSSGTPHGPNNSSVEAFYDWYRIDENGKQEIVARTEMLTTWVRVIGHGIVEVAPFPSTFQTFFSSVPASNVTPLEMASNSVLSEPLYSAPPGVATGPVLAEQVFDTSLEDSNLVGNVYFSSYMAWMGRARDSFFNRIAPEILKDASEGEPFCIRCQVKHLREAMPFDQIQVVMRLQSLYEDRISLYFDYYQFIDGKRAGKIAFGEHELVWTKDPRQAISPKSLPGKLMYYLKKCIRDQETALEIKKAS